MISPRPPLFAISERTDNAVGQHGESTFDFLNRIGGEHWDASRRLMQAWLDHIEEDEDYVELCERFRSGDDEQFRSAFLELYLHESLLRAGYSVTVHPSIRGTSKRPDLLAERGDARIFIEAIAPGPPPDAKAAANRRAVLFDVVNALDAPNHVLWLVQLEEGDHPPRSARLRSALKAKLAELDPDDDWTFENAPSLEWSDRGWSATFKAIPKKPSARGQDSKHRAIGVYSHNGAQFVDDAPMIREALARKHHRYGDLRAQFIIAVGTYIHDTDHWHATNALYGRLAFEYSTEPESGSEPREIRQTDGYFGSLPSWQNHGVSGVLLVNQLMPHGVPHAEVNLWRHPNPTHSLPSDLGLPWREFTFNSYEVAETPPPEDAGHFFGLPGPWPPGTAWPGAD